MKKVDFDFNGTVELCTQYWSGICYEIHATMENGENLRDYCVDYLRDFLFVKGIEVDEETLQVIVEFVF